MKREAIAIPARFGNAIPKLALCCFLLVCVSMRVRAQGESFTYNFGKGFLQGEGYSVVSDKYCYLAKGETCEITYTFYAGNTYKIYAFSDDDDVKDVDVYAYYADGTEYSKDASNSSIGSLIISPYSTRTMTIRWKNYASNNPRYQSTLYLLIGYK